jgi:hypothetical protein
VNVYLHTQLLHPILHNTQLHRDNARHLNSPTETDLAISLTKVQIAHTKLRTLDQHRQENLTAPRQILDIAVPAMLRSTGYSSCAFLPDLIFDILSCATGMDVLGLGRLRDIALHVFA